MSIPKMKKYVVRYVSGYADQVESETLAPQNFEGVWLVWLLDYRVKSLPTAAGIGELVRITQQLINMANVEKIQDSIPDADHP